jgi:Zn finger protein HypA/HybF involved in hydrogenase expression
LLLPFAVFGIRRQLDRLLTQTAEMKNQLQHAINILDPDGVKARLHEQYAESLSDRRTAECPHCQQQVSLKTLPAGAQHQCPHCKKTMDILS